MEPRHLNKRLLDILNAIEEIEGFVKEKGKRFDIFKSDRMFLRSVQMNIAIIGEAMNKILEQHPQININNARKIVDTRNYVIHGYDSLSEEILWGIVIKNLPILKQEITTLLQI